MRGGALNQKEAAKSANRPVHLIRIDLGCSDSSLTNQVACELNGGSWTDPVFMTDWDRPITFQSNEYLAVGHFLGLGTITETSTLQVSSLPLSLSGVDREWLALLFRTEYIDRPIIVYRGFVDATGLLIANPFEIFRGQIDQPLFHTTSASTTITLSVKNHLANFDRKSGRHTNNAEMRRHFPGDASFVYASEGLKEIRWGKE